MAVIVASSVHERHRAAPELPALPQAARAARVSPGARRRNARRARHGRPRAGHLHVLRGGSADPRAGARGDLRRSVPAHRQLIGALNFASYSSKSDTRSTTDIAHLPLTFREAPSTTKCPGPATCGTSAIGAMPFSGSAAVTRISLVSSNGAPVLRSKM